MKYIKQNKFMLLFAALVGIVAVFDTASASALSIAGFAGVTEAVKSTPITNADATPAVLNKAQIAGGRVLEHRGVALVTTTKDIGSTYRFFRVKSSDLVSQLLLDNATCGAACTADFGLYRTAADGGAVVSAALFASALDMNTANRALDITRESGTITVANMEKKIWELLALSADPQIDYDVAATLTAASAATGSVCLTGRVVGNA